MAETPHTPTPQREHTLADKLHDIAVRKKQLEVEEQLLINKAVKSDNPADIVKAMEVVQIRQNPASNDKKSIILDPNTINSTFGYRQPTTRMTYQMLRAMSRVPLINAILRTRINQIAAFSAPQSDRFSTGFIIRKKGHSVEDMRTLSKEDRVAIDNITEFLINTGAQQSWDRDDFDTFLRKYSEDSLALDQASAEIVRNRGGAMSNFFALDGGLIRVADSYIDSEYEGDRKQIAGYYPNYVQVVDAKVVAEFYPWELMFAVRNPSTAMTAYGYGRSELEDLVSIVTSMLWSDQYNQNFFKIGAAPKGILQIKGGANSPRLAEFKQQWQAMVAGVDNAWRTPVIDSDEMTWIDLQKNSRDMEFSMWQEYLIKIVCALYVIDPSEIGFPSGQSAAAGQPMFESNNTAKLSYSRDKGLKPLLKFLQAKINKYIVSQLNPDFVFEFVGVDAESPEQYQKRVAAEVMNYKTINEVRKEANMDPLEDGDIVMNPTYLQAKQAAAFVQPTDEDGAPSPAEPPSEDTQKATTFYAHDDNPFIKDLNKYIDVLNHQI